MRAPSLTALLALLIPLLAACSSSGHWYFSGDDEHHDWSYLGETGPDHWGSLSADYALADSGHAQSPIDLPSDAPVSSDLPPLLVDYHATDAHWVNNGHSLQHDEDGTENFLRWGGVNYELAQYHLHTPSEHTIDGLHAAAEVHLVHKNEAGQVLVLAVLVVEGDERTDLLVEIDRLPMNPGDESDLSEVRDPRSMLPADLSYWTYDGSFTTPPCTEGVTWIVLREKAVRPEALLRRLGEILGRNNRPIRPLNGRVVTASD